jgi:hypothetical protein
LLLQSFRRSDVSSSVKDQNALHWIKSKSMEHHKEYAFVITILQNMLVRALGCRRDLNTGSAWDECRECIDLEEVGGSTGAS